jgi:endonuclease III
MTKREKRERLSKIADRLEEIYPNAECALEYGGDPWKLLVMGRLSAQCTDARVNIVCRELFGRFPTLEALADAPIEEFYTDSRSDEPMARLAEKAFIVKGEKIKPFRFYD